MKRTHLNAQAAITSTTITSTTTTNIQIQKQQTHTHILAQQIEHFLFLLAKRFCMFHPHQQTAEGSRERQLQL